MRRGCLGNCRVWENPLQKRHLRTTAIAVATHYWGSEEAKVNLDTARAREGKGYLFGHVRTGQRV